MTAPKGIWTLALAGLIVLGIGGLALAAEPTAGNWGVASTATQAKNVRNPNTGHLFVIVQNANNQTVIEDAILIHPCAGKPSTKWHEVALFDYRKGYISVVNGGSFSYHGTAYLQQGGQPGRPPSKTVSVSFSGRFTGARRATGSYQVHAPGCQRHGFIAIWYD